jgi:hypothetical protein
MSKKKRKVQQPQHISPFQKQKQQEAVNRLARLLKYASAPPEPLLSIFSRCQIPWERVQNVPGKPEFDTIVVKVSDMENGEKINMQQGSVLNRLYGTVIPSTSAQLPTHVMVPVERESEPEGQVPDQVSEPVTEDAKEPEKPPMNFSNDEIDDYLNGIQG